MNIGITGATGFIGTHLIDYALRRGHEVIAFSRNPSHQIPGCTMRPFPQDGLPDISNCQALVHLAGESVFGLWTPSKKRKIRESRIQGTRQVVAAIQAAPVPPEVFVCGSAVGIYGDGGESELTERSPAGSGFLAETARDWELEASLATQSRVVLVRTSLVLGNDGGALAAMLPIFKLGLGGPIGSGHQWMAWIHIQDQVRLILFALENLDIAGPLNASAPWPVRNQEFATVLGATLRRPALLRIPGFALALLGEFRRELLDSKRVLPEIASEHGFGFLFPELSPALKNLVG